MDAKEGKDRHGHPEGGEDAETNAHPGEKEERILEAALDVFSQNGFRGATIDQIAEAAGMSKPNLLYYFRTKEAIHRHLIDRVLFTWLEPLRAFDAEGNPDRKSAPISAASLKWPEISRAKAGFSPMRCCRARRISRMSQRPLEGAGR